MDRALLPILREHLSRKILLLSGPRQAGKTTLARMVDNDHDYVSHDVAEHRRLLRTKAWDRKKRCVIFDELHKMKGWKTWLKGIYDTEGIPPGYIVTGSARLDTYKKMGDSLAGRFFGFRLHPLDVREILQLDQTASPQATLDRILEFGGFPEPFLEGTSKFYGMWSRSHLDIILRQDLIDTESVQSIPAIETLIDMIAERVGSPISYRSLCEDLQISDKTVKRWLTILENMFVIFKVPPFHRNIARARQKQPKYYLYDVARVRGDKGAKLENAVACSLFKECQYRQDALGERYELHYLAKRGGPEIDFIVTRDLSPTVMLEVKWSDPEPSPAFRIFAKGQNEAAKVQLVHLLNRESTYPNGVEVRRASTWLANWSPQ
ncbi:MAG: ATPase [Deltaproteobacteria bacterium RIFOXYA12_FULL_58_15]|nr:MAG: ATPase [Deltaproteobacteria bacterium RIFOXYA12_FULL_58_15]OGR07322.1 MAG: ATPase [Deltaproteobacteria bacterium RIFOXYB12_FULL_58_9]